MVSFASIKHTKLLKDFMYLMKLLHFQTTWFRHYCFLNMGRHYFQLNYDVNAPCDDLTPIQLIYSGGVLNGFVWQHPAALEGDRWETVFKYFLHVKRQCLFTIIDAF